MSELLDEMEASYFIPILAHKAYLCCKFKLFFFLSVDLMELATLVLPPDTLFTPTYITMWSTFVVIALQTSLAHVREVTLDKQLHVNNNNISFS